MKLQMQDEEGGMKKRIGHRGACVGLPLQRQAIWRRAKPWESRFVTPRQASSNLRIFKRSDAGLAISVRPPGAPVSKLQYPAIEVPVIGPISGMSMRCELGQLALRPTRRIGVRRSMRQTLRRDRPAHWLGEDDQ